MISYTYIHNTLLVPDEVPAASAAARVVLVSMQSATPPLVALLVALPPLSSCRPACIAEEEAVISSALARREWAP